MLKTVRARWRQVRCNRLFVDRRGSGMRKARGQRPRANVFSANRSVISGASCGICEMSRGYCLRRRRNATPPSISAEPRSTNVDGSGTTVDDPASHVATFCEKRLLSASAM